MPSFPLGRNHNPRGGGPMVRCALRRQYSAIPSPARTSYLARNRQVHIQNDQTLHASGPTIQHLKLSFAPPWRSTSAQSECLTWEQLRGPDEADDLNKRPSGPNLPCSLDDPEASPTFDNLISCAVGRGRKRNDELSLGIEMTIH